LEIRLIEIALQFDDVAPVV